MPAMDPIPLADQIRAAEDAVRDLEQHDPRGQLPLARQILAHLRSLVSPVTIES